MMMAQSHILRKGPRYPVHPSVRPQDREEDHEGTVRTTTAAAKGVKSPPGAGAIQRRAAFVKLANDRMVRAIDAITLIGNLANKKNYRYTETDVAAMEAALQETVDQTIRYFRSPREDRPTFSLPMEEEDEAA